MEAQDMVGGQAPAGPDPPKKADIPRDKNGIPLHRSVSQVKGYLPELGGCPYQYKLQRVVRAWQRPAAWFAMGTAFHAVAEAYDRSDGILSVEEAKEKYRELYTEEINETLADTRSAFWFASGPYAGMDDITRRFDVGQNQVAGYIDYRRWHPEEVIWVTPDGQLGLELGFDIDLEGVPVRGFIDQVLEAPIKKKTEVIVNDHKTGADPGPAFQLKVYAIAVEQTWDQEIRWGRYWMGKTGKPRRPVDLTLVSRNEVVDLFHKADEGIRAGDWTPNPGPGCTRCSVRTACEYAAPEE